VKEFAAGLDGMQVIEKERRMMDVAEEDLSKGV
jgi:hypothetical protein